MFIRSLVVVAAVFTPFGVAYADAALDGSALKIFFSDSKMQYTSGDNVKHLEYKADGTAQQLNPDGTINKGKWKIQGDKYCTIWPSRKSWKCFSVVRTEDGRFADMDGSQASGYFARQ